ncbi:hypothetical protein LZ554_006430 [Drepanopeziza brunnea f. sp. 'monogermtubi']|nr:hypothetical protein LZ554_006430 [Drepanopeziza brunnea f. sp. 'monogermtubi']
MATLPLEIYLLILPLLSATSLVAFAQTNRYFRNLINPDRELLVNRLLELECLPQYGGGEVTINAKAKIIVPSGLVAYACTRCLRIVPHTHFDNHALLRLRFRKPPPGSRVAGKSGGWVSGNAKTRGLHRQAELRSDTLENWMRRIDPATHSTAEWKALYHIGTDRRRRWCNECKFVTGVWARASSYRSGWESSLRTSNIGPVDVPVIKGRHRRCHDSTERFFWDLFPLADDAECPWRFQVHRRENCDWWTLWWIRCPGCTVWQEVAAFRRGQGSAVKATPSDPEFSLEGGQAQFEHWRCNHCFVAEHGEEELWWELMEFWEEKVDYEVTMFRSNLEDTFGVLDWIEDATEGRYSWASILAMDSISSPQPLTEVPTGRELQEVTDDSARRQYYMILKRWYHTLDHPEEVLGRLLNENFFRSWIDGYEVLEKRVKKLLRRTQMLQQDRSILIRYALDGEGLDERQEEALCSAMADCTDLPGFCYSFSKLFIAHQRLNY